MRESDLTDFLVLEKKQYCKLTEVLDLTRQMAEAVDRQDQISVRMLVSMRQEPLDQLRQVRENSNQRRRELSDQARAQVDRLLAGGTPEEPAERELSMQAASNRRLLERVIEMDRRVSRRLGGGDSFYDK